MNRKVEIVDRLTNEPEPPKIPIKLYGCLQSTTDIYGNVSFGSKKIGEENWPIPQGVKRIERVFQQRIDGGMWDIIICHRENYHPCLYIGKWNDGVLP